MPAIRFILVALIGVSPALLLWDGLIAQGVVAGIVSVALAIAARALRPGEIGFLVSAIRLPAVFAVIPALWVILQLLPLGVFSHPIWSSAQAALKYSLPGAISINPATSTIALGQYLLLAAVAFLSAAVAVDRRRAESILFALTVAVAVAALITLAHDTLFPGVWLAASARTEAVDCAIVGIIVAATACIRAREHRRETKTQRQVRSRRALVACSAALAICAAASFVGSTREALFAGGYGLLAFVGVAAVRRFGSRLLGVIGIAVPALGVAILLLATHPVETGTGVLVTFADAESSRSPAALTQRMIDDAPLVGTGAGTFATLEPIYREFNDPPFDSAATAAATLAIELGQPMLWLIVATTAVAIVLLLRASLRRRRDAFYPAMGGSCLLSLLLLAFVNAGLMGTTAGLILAATLGLAVAQSKSRTAQ